MKEYDDILNPKKQQGGESPKVPMSHGEGQGGTERDDIITADNITATLKISRQELERAMKKLHTLTGADKLHQAFNLVWYKLEGTDRSTAEQMGMITTLYRCAKDGSVRPPVDLDDYYREVNGLSNNNTTGTGLKPSL